MKITVIGCSTPYPRANRPCSGYLLSSADTAILLDCGSGVFAALLEHVDPKTLAAVWVSHMHPDHFADLAALANWALNTEEAPKLRIFGPMNWDKRLNSFISPDPAVDTVKDIFEVRYIGDGDTATIGDIELTSRLVRHSVPTFGVRAQDAKGNIFSYSGDTGMCDGVNELARDADIFLCEAGSSEPVPYHLTAAQALEIAQRGNAGRLLVTHVPEGVTVRVPEGGSVPSELVKPGDEWTVGE
ncbi:MBL fold metallo-hydrolase [Amycolatopsis sp. cg5]|uniref:MBL fold metallo-hydrolase n=1 Tax=Amycolatopsis sp. cg5 TaxID=3238802 RepID=UPI003523B651